MYWASTIAVSFRKKLLLKAIDMQQTCLVNVLFETTTIGELR